MYDFFCLENYLLNIQIIMTLEGKPIVIYLKHYGLLGKLILPASQAQVHTANADWLLF